MVKRARAGLVLPAAAERVLRGGWSEHRLKSKHSIRERCQRGRGSCSHVSKLLLPGHVTFRPLFIQTRPEVRGQTDAAGSAASELWSRAGSVDTQSPPSVGLMICHPVASMNMALRLLVI